MGNTQLLSDGGMFVGWGTTPERSEFAADGTLRFDAAIAGDAFSVPRLPPPVDRTAGSLPRTSKPSRTPTAASSCS